MADINNNIFVNKETLEIIKINSNEGNYIYDKTMHMYYYKSSNERIYIKHNSWADFVILNNITLTLFRESDVSETGRYVINEKENDKRILIYWDKWNMEVFKYDLNSLCTYSYINNDEENKNENNNVLEKYYQLIHNNWNDIGIVKGSFIKRQNTNNETGKIIIKENIMTIDWDNWDSEDFYIIDNKCYFVGLIKKYLLGEIIYYLNFGNNYLYNSNMSLIGNFVSILSSDTNSKVVININGIKRTYLIDGENLYEEKRITLVKYKLEEEFIIYNNKIISITDGNLFNGTFYYINDLTVIINWSYNKIETYNVNQNDYKYYLVINETKYTFIDKEFGILKLSMTGTYFYDDNNKYYYLLNKGKYYFIVNDVIYEFIMYKEFIYLSSNLFKMINEFNFSPKIYNNVNGFNSIEEGILNWSVNNNDSIYSINTFNKRYKYFDIENFKNKNKIRLNNENTIINWLVRYRFSNQFYSNLKIDIIDMKINSSDNLNIVVASVNSLNELDTLSNLLFKKNITLFVILRNIVNKEIIENLLNSYNNIYIMKIDKEWKSEFRHYFIINEISNIIKEANNICYIKNLDVSNLNLNEVDVSQLNVNELNEEYIINGLLTINNDISNRSLVEIENPIINIVNEYVTNIYDLVKYLIIYYLIMKYNIDKIGNQSFFSYYELVEIFDIYNEKLFLC